MKIVNLIKTEKTFENMAAELAELMPEGLEVNQLETSTEIQLDMRAGQALGIASNTLAYAENKLLDAQTRVKKEIERFDGSEVRDQRLQRATQWYRMMEAQLEIAETTVGTRADP